ncbi:MAG: hypothetical protein AB7H48_12980, partial [Parachlamydiales bacterium]
MKKRVQKLFVLLALVFGYKPAFAAEVSVVLEMFSTHCKVDSAGHVSNIKCGTARYTNQPIHITFKLDPWLGSVVFGTSSANVSWMGGCPST